MCFQRQGYRRISPVMSESSVPESTQPLHNNSLTLLKGFAVGLKRATESGQKKKATALTHGTQSLVLN